MYTCLSCFKSNCLPETKHIQSYQQIAVMIHRNPNQTRTTNVLAISTHLDEQEFSARLKRSAKTNTLILLYIFIYLCAVHASNVCK